VSAIRVHKSIGFSDGRQSPWCIPVPAGEYVVSVAPTAGELIITAAVAPVAGIWELLHADLSVACTGLSLYVDGISQPGHVYPFPVGLYDLSRRVVDRAVASVRLSFRRDPTRDDW
jgi:hypothetical protein